MSKERKNVSLREFSQADPFILLLQFSSEKSQLEERDLLTVSPLFLE